MSKSKKNSKRSKDKKNKTVKPPKIDKNGLLKCERKLLEEAGIEYSLKMKGDKRAKKWQKEFLSWGFDTRDTWNLDVTMLELLLERLWLYREIAPVDLTYHKVKIGKSEATIETAINEIIEDLQKLLGELDKYSSDEAVLKEYGKIQRKIWRTWGTIAPYVWW